MPIKDKKSGIRIDLIFSFTDYEREAISRAKKIKIKKTFVNFASLEDVIIHKIFAGRPRDIEDLKSIIIKNPNYNINYITKWFKKFDKSAETKRFFKSFKKIIENL